MNIATNTLSQIGHFLKGDMLFFVVCFLIFGIFTLYAGRGRMLSLIFAYYPATILFNNLPFINKLLVLDGSMLVVNKIALFLIFLLPLSIIIKSYIFSESMYSGLSHILRTGGFAIIGLVFVVMFSYTTVNYDVFHNFLPSIDSLFNPINKVFYWNLGIFALLAVL